MADTKQTLHPITSEGTISPDDNFYPKTTADQIYDSTGTFRVLVNESGNLNVQEKLISGDNLKTINNISLLGSGNIDILQMIRDLIYPVGSLYMTTDPTYNPQTVIGGTWERIKDKFIMAAGDTYTVSGGSATVTLQANNVPNHTHAVNVSGTIDPVSYTIYGPAVGDNGTFLNATSTGASAYTGIGERKNYSFGTQGSWEISGGTLRSITLGTYSRTISSSGTSQGNNPAGAQPFSILPPYEIAYVWKRTE